MPRLFKIPDEKVTIDLDKISYVKGPWKESIADEDAKYTIAMSNGDKFFVYDTNFWPSKKYPYSEFIKLWEGND